MIITFSGCDGVGKSTHVNGLKNLIMKNNDCSAVNLIDVVNNNLVYENISDLDKIYSILSESDIITSRFYMRSKSSDKLQKAIRMGNAEIFDNTYIIRKLLELIRIDAELWQDRVIDKLENNHKIIIFDRYYYDEMAYRSLYKLNIEEIKEYFVNCRKPDLSYLITVSKNALYDRNCKREDSSSTLFKNDLKLNELYNTFLEIKDRYGLIEVNTENMIESQVDKIIYDEFLNYLDINKNHVGGRQND